MDREKACREIVELFIRAVNKYNAFEKIPVTVGGEYNLYHSERHMLDMIGAHPNMNITEFAKALGVTKGAVSQVVKKLENKGVVTRHRSSDNEKEVYLDLTKAGRGIYVKHQKVNKETIEPLLDALQRYPDDKVEFLVTMFRWIEGFLDLSKEEMKRRR